MALNFVHDHQLLSRIKNSSVDSLALYYLGQFCSLFEFSDLDLELNSVAEFIAQFAASRSGIEYKDGELNFN